VKDKGAYAARLEGSNPSSGTKTKIKSLIKFKNYL